jgi:uncharacterized sodium:solute symporter family permease YidK
MDLFYMNSYNSRNLYLFEVCFNIKLIVDVVFYYIKRTLTEITSKVLTKHTLVSPSLHNRFKQIMVTLALISMEAKLSHQDDAGMRVLFGYYYYVHHSSFIHSVPLPSAECDNSLPFAGASSIPVIYPFLPPFSTN